MNFRPMYKVVVWTTVLVAALMTKSALCSENALAKQRDTAALVREALFAGQPDTGYFIQLSEGDSALRSVGSLLADENGWRGVSIAVGRSDRSTWQGSDRHQALSVSALCSDSALHATARKVPCERMTDVVNVLPRVDLLLLSGGSLGDALAALSSVEKRAAAVVQAEGVRCIDDNGRDKCAEHLFRAGFCVAGRYDGAVFWAANRHERASVLCKQPFGRLTAKSLIMNAAAAARQLSSAGLRTQRKSTAIRIELGDAQHNESADPLEVRHVQAQGTPEIASSREEEAALASRLSDSNDVVNSTVELNQELERLSAKNATMAEAGFIELDERAENSTEATAESSQHGNASTRLEQNMDRENRMATSVDGSGTSAGLARKTDIGAIAESKDAAQTMTHERNHTSTSSTTQHRDSAPTERNYSTSHDALSEISQPPHNQQDNVRSRFSQDAGLDEPIRELLEKVAALLGSFDARPRDSWPTGAPAAAQSGSHERPLLQQSEQQSLAASSPAAAQVEAAKRLESAAHKSRDSQHPSRESALFDPVAHGEHLKMITTHADTTAARVHGFREELDYAISKMSHQVTQLVSAAHNARTQAGTLESVEFASSDAVEDFLTSLGELHKLVSKLIQAFEEESHGVLQLRSALENADEKLMSTHELIEELRSETDRELQRSDATQTAAALREDLQFDAETRAGLEARIRELSSELADAHRELNLDGWLSAGAERLAGIAGDTAELTNAALTKLGVHEVEDSLDRAVDRVIDSVERAPLELLELALVSAVALAALGSLTGAIVLIRNRAASPWHVVVLLSVMEAWMLALLLFSKLCLGVDILLVVHDFQAPFGASFSPSAALLTFFHAVLCAQVALKVLALWRLARSSRRPLVFYVVAYASLSAGALFLYASGVWMPCSALRSASESCEFGTSELMLLCCIQSAMLALLVRSPRVALYTNEFAADDAYDQKLLDADSRYDVENPAAAVARELTHQK
mmetsp:Transcript_15570/g.41909  ORF Transcript_15570/g.41909 Transcript_15570/m.41909 type:complete len:985 (+) Transcript_15570:134-3088(+)|eukprot:CAMPEP_0185834446 /NCGR_PEP_ID=MMETSP1353-20130828/5343_1 /TAXON_ID=1077150 /ORGANISM="Erythrolobus australicus, Strain CCMP3124" /LENGTH=984 /DNA_ID=CAMNT_0028532877 /DNA_START=85 /DNA_END=3039 /DNA_ORIENTATION=+